MRKQIIGIILLSLIVSITACNNKEPFPTEQKKEILVEQPIVSHINKSTPTPSFNLLETRIPGSEHLVPTSDPIHMIPTLNPNPDTYLVQTGDYLSRIAMNFRVSVDALIKTNNITDPDNLPVGMILNIPFREFQEVGSEFKIIPDSELVYGPMNIWFDLKGFIEQQSGYLSGYFEEVEGNVLSGTEIISMVSKNYSVNPRLLLAILEYRSGWLTQSNPSESSQYYPLGFENLYYTGLYKQLTWAADNINRGYYLWKVNGLSDIITTDSKIVPLSPVINAGTAGVQFYFANVDDYEHWKLDISKEGLFKEFNLLFGDPFDLSIDPLVPVDLMQPEMVLPFESGQIWSFTGGPHGGWGSGSAWAALDFAPPGDAKGCVESDAWVTAVADGLIVRIGNGIVIQDLDGDGYEQSGWVILYMHIGTAGRVQYGSDIEAGERLGHPSCEGGISTGTHVHIARKFNGEWISADGKVPFNLGGWISSGTGVKYDGYLTRGNQVVEAFSGNDPINEIQH